MKTAPAMTLLAVIPVLLLSACGDGAPAAGAGAAPGPGAGGGMPVEAEVLATQRFTQEIVAVGSLSSEESVTVSSEIAGRIASIHFSEGQPVEAGALLFKLDDSVYQAEFGQAQAALKLSESDHARAQELFARKMVSARERDAAAARLEVDRAALALAEARLAKTRIRAPFRGVAGLRAVSPGDYINPGQPLAPLEALAVLKADFRLSEAALSLVRVGQSLALEVDAYPGETFTGKVYAIDPRLVEESRSVAVRARVPNADRRLRPGLFARVRLVVSDAPEALLVPEQSLMPQGQDLFVYVIEDGKAAMRKVEIGTRRAGRAVVLSGLSGGETVITAGLQKIGPGSPVMAVNLAPPPEQAPEAAAQAKPAKS